MVVLAKPALDVGLFTNQREPMLAFWQQRAGARFQEDLPIGGGMLQHRHGFGDSVLKINHVRDLLPRAAASGIRRLVIAEDGRTSPEMLIDPDGNHLCLVPPGRSEPDPRRDGGEPLSAPHQDFYGSALGLPAIDDVTFRCGASQIRLIEGDAAKGARPCGSATWPTSLSCATPTATGWRYPSENP